MNRNTRDWWKAPLASTLIVVACIVTISCGTVPVTQKALDCTEGLSRDTLTEACTSEVPLHKGDKFEDALRQRMVNDSSLGLCAIKVQTLQAALQKCSAQVKQLNSTLGAK